MLKIKTNYLSILILFLLMVSSFNLSVKGQEIKNVSIHDLKYNQLKNLKKTSSQIKFIKPLKHLEFDFDDPNEKNKQFTLRFYSKQESKQESKKKRIAEFCFFELQGEYLLTMENFFEEDHQNYEKDDAIDEYLEIYHAPISNEKILVNIEPIEPIEPETKKQNTQTPVEDINNESNKLVKNVNNDTKPVEKNKKTNLKISFASLWDYQTLGQAFLGVSMLIFFILFVYRFIKSFINCNKEN
ncbi:hypothetical protein [Candidatus Phytoplasma pyri]|uniref:hypothetical protein n=1 Tax=Candidatus Phytoplasma pyri TaxID=47566 RepID=UPI003982EDF2